MMVKGSATSSGGMPNAGVGFHLAAASSVATPAFLPSSVLGKIAENGWDLGPFVKRKEPVLQPTPESVFTCPIRGTDVRWEEQNTYNPAAVLRGGKVYLLYRADDRSPDLRWGRTCRIGLAHSDDGVHFTQNTTPVLYPDNDEWKQYEWEGGCEDLHIIEGEDGTYYMRRALLGTQRWPTGSFRSGASGCSTMVQRIG